MYIPDQNAFTEPDEIFGFMKKFSFAVVVSASDNFPTGTHLPFLVEKSNGKITLTSHFAKANDHWKTISQHQALVIFSEPHAYISPQHYEDEREVPTWNYVSVHAYGKAQIISDEAETKRVLERTIGQYDTEYQKQWQSLPSDFKRRLLKGIVAFEIEVTDLQAKKKLSQNKSERERSNIVSHLSNSVDSNEKAIAEYMAKK